MKKIAMFALSAAAALMTLSVHAAWTLNDAETSATDGAWTLAVAADEIDGVTGLKVTSVSMGESSDLDLSTFETDAGKKIPDYRKVRKAIVGFIGDVETKNGEFVRVREQKLHREFTESGNGPCWVIDADWKPKGFSVIVR